MCHDVIFDAAYNGYFTDEPFFMSDCVTRHTTIVHEYSSTMNRAAVLGINPINYVPNRLTPHVVIHGSEDYRPRETEGIGTCRAFKYCIYISKIYDLIRH